MITLAFFHDVRYVGRIFVKGTGKPVEILAKLNEMAGFDPDEEIDLYEVICLHLSLCLSATITFYFQPLSYPMFLYARK